MKTIAIASDHAGFELKNTLKNTIEALGYKLLDLGTNSAESVDYPDYGYKLATAVSKGDAELGVAICGSGIGISIAANRKPKVRAALCHNVETAKLARQHNNANVLALGARMVSSELAVDMLKTFLSTEFEGGRHENRVKKLGSRN
jgi:ribose 5-phosphate isomerase B